MEVLVLLEVKNLGDQAKMEKHVVKEGFEVVQGEEYVYSGTSSTTMFSTKAYILEVFKKGLQKTTFDSCKMAFLLDETSYPAYEYDFETCEFELINE
jgi:hypothetical protein